MHDRARITELKANRGRLVQALEDAGGTALNDGDKLRCPFHPDEHPSGGIHRCDDDGAWLYTCHGCTWNGNEHTGDIIDVVRRAHGCDFRGALDRLGVGGNGRMPHAAPEPKLVDKTDQTRRFATAAHVQLLADSAVLEHLWRTRGIDKATAQRFRLGITGAPGRRY